MVQSLERIQLVWVQFNLIQFDRNKLCIFKETWKTNFKRENILCGGLIFKHEILSRNSYSNITKPLIAIYDFQISCLLLPRKNMNDVSCRHDITEILLKMP